MQASGTVHWQSVICVHGVQAKHTLPEEQLLMAKKAISCIPCVLAEQAHAAAGGSC